MGFKENLKSELIYTGILVKELSIKTGIKKHTLDNYLNTHNSLPNAEAAVKIADKLSPKNLRLAIKMVKVLKDEEEV